MTVIVYRDGVIASDSLECYKYHIWTNNCKKLYRLTKNVYLGLAGASANGLLLLEAMRKIQKNKEKKLLPPGPWKGVEAIFVDHDTVWMYDSTWRKIDPKETPYIALGVGAAEALVALDLGASATEAVQATINRNVFCGGRIQHYEVK